MLLFGTIVNIITIIIGSLIGILFHSKLPERLSKIIFQAIGLFTMYIGFDMASKTNNLLILIFSMILGAGFGQWIDIEKYVERFSCWVKQVIRSKNATFTEGLITAFLLFCIGSMTILGAFDEGTRGNSDLLIAKSLMDGVGSVALASALGIGVMFSVLPLFIFQGGLTVLAYFIGNAMPQSVVNELTAVGGLLLIGLGFSLLDIKKIKVINMMPALVFGVLLAYIFIWLDL
jgi:hypothetical protein